MTIKPAFPAGTLLTRALAGGLLVAGCMTTTGCDATHQESRLTDAPALLAAKAEPPAIDGRARFRANFCSLLEQESRTGAKPSACDSLLWKLDDEPPPAQATRTMSPPEDLRIYVVGGAFSDCFGEASVAFREGMQRLQARGAKVAAIPIESRSGAHRNASLIAERLRGDAVPLSAHVILLGYSKGAVDILHFLANHPADAAAVDAVVSVAGPVRGSALAERGSWLYDHLLAHAFSKRCTGGDGGVIDSIRLGTQGDWLAQNTLPKGVRFYTLSAFPSKERLARALRPSWQMIAANEARNDGQVSVTESLIPGSTLLGYANADHWDVAIDIEQTLGLLGAPRGIEPFPRAVLFEAIVNTVAEDLNDVAGEARE